MLGIATVAQTIVLSPGSVALLADLIHNYGYDRAEPLDTIEGLPQLRQRRRSRVIPVLLLIAPNKALSRVDRGRRMSPSG